MTEHMTVAQKGRDIKLKIPQPCCPSASASPTAEAGNSNRIMTVFRTTIQMLLVHRTPRMEGSLRRGASTSQTTIRAKIPRKKPNRIDCSYAKFATPNKFSAEPTGGNDHGISMSWTHHSSNTHSKGLKRVPPYTLRNSTRPKCGAGCS